MLYVWFLFISFVFWLTLTLNNSFQQDLLIPLKLKSVSDSTTMISDVPQAIRITLKDRVPALLTYRCGIVPTLQLDFSEYSNGLGVL